MMSCDRSVNRGDVWRRIRALRAQPPGRGGLPARKATFSAALEQSEQLFAAAASVGYAARPLPLFYALSQAGRAIAASDELGKDEWRLRGHGIRASDLGAERVWRVRVQNSGSGSFTRIAALLGSPSLPEATRLGDVWATLPDLARRLPHDAYEARALYVKPEEMNVRRYFGGTPVPSSSSDLALAWLYGVDSSIEREADQEAALRAQLRRYPTLEGYEESIPLRLHPAAAAGETGVRLAWKAEGLLEQDRARRIEQMCCHSADGQLWVAPALPGNSGPLHPLVAWWAVLYALSMLARYEPAAWTTYIDVDCSPDAVAIETLLDHALSELPRLLLEFLGRSTR